LRATARVCSLSTTRQIVSRVPQLRDTADPSTTSKDRTRRPVVDKRTHEQPPPRRNGLALATPWAAPGKPRERPLLAAWAASPRPISGTSRRTTAAHDDGCTATKTGPEPREQIPAMLGLRRGYVPGVGESGPFLGSPDALGVNGARVGPCEQGFRGLRFRSEVAQWASDAPPSFLQAAGCRSSAASRGGRRARHDGIQATVAPARRIGDRREFRG
jgi:hypothetical protein